MDDRYEVRTLDDPIAMPMGSVLLSTHATLEYARAAVAQEIIDFHASPSYTRGAYLSRAIILVQAGGNVRTRVW